MIADLGAHLPWAESSSGSFALATVGGGSCRGVQMSAGVRRMYDVVLCTVVGHVRYGLLIESEDGERGFAGSAYINDLPRQAWPASSSPAAPERHGADLPRTPRRARPRSTGSSAQAACPGFSLGFATYIA
jgi:hypothetical protein